MGKLYGQRPTPATVNVPSGRPGRGQFPGIPQPISFGDGPAAPAKQSGQFPNKPQNLDKDPGTANHLDQE